VVLQDSEVLLQLQVALRQLKEIRQVGSLDARIEAPQVGTSQMQQQVRLRSGSTLVLTGFVQDRVGTDAQGVGNAKFGLAGGGRNGDRRRKLLVLIVTPRITG
jgi:type II secretory pathway component GspD/PulD (secretin)